MDISSLPLDKIKQYRDTFHDIDRDRSGTISLDELREYFKLHGREIDERVLRSVVSLIDTDNSGELDFTEFVQFMTRTTTTEDVESLIRTAFKVFDKDGKGYLLADNLRDTITNMGISLNQQDLDEIMAEADTDGNGKLDEQEFVDIVMQWGAARLHGENK